MLDNQGKNTDTHSEYVKLIAFPRQQWLRERASVWRYTYIGSLVNVKFEQFFLFIWHVLPDSVPAGWNM